MQKADAIRATELLLGLEPRPEICKDVGVIYIYIYIYLRV